MATRALLTIVIVALTACAGASSSSPAGAPPPARTAITASHHAILHGWMAYRSGDDDTATANFHRALSGNPHQSDAHYGLALVDERHARFDEAVDELRQASEAAPHSAVYLAALGDACLKAGRLDEARQALQALRTLAVDHDVAPAQIRILSGGLARAERLDAARHDTPPAPPTPPTSRGRSPRP